MLTVLTSVVVEMRGALQMARRKPLLSGQNLLSIAGLGFIPAGIILILLSWHPTPGPYRVGGRYPYGGSLEAWQVSMGFAFVAFGVLFVAGIAAAVRLKSRRLWGAMLAAYVLVWFPHAFLGAAFFLDDPSLAALQSWAGVVPLILLWMAMVIAGFALTWRDAAQTPTEGGTALNSSPE